MVLVAVVCALVAAALGLPGRLWQEPQRIESLGADPTRPPRRAVALLGFRNLSGLQETAWLSTALSEMLGSELAASESLRTVPGENVVRTRRDLELEEADSYGRETLERIRVNLGADLLVLGSYLSLGEKSGGRIRLDLRVQDAVAGEVVVSLRQEGSEAEIFELVSRSGAELRSRLGVEPPSAEALTAVRRSMPADAEPRRLYVEGLEKLRLLEAPAARERLQKAVAIEPGFALGHAALAEAWNYSGYQLRAREAAKKALDLAAGLPRQERLLIEARYRQTSREWDQAIEAYRTLFEFYPDNLEYGLSLAAVQTEAQKLNEALVTVEALRKLPAPMRDDPRIDLAEARATPEEPERRLAAALRAKAKAEARGARGISVEARFFEISNLEWIRGEIANALAALQEQKAACAAIGDQRCLARALNEMGYIFSRTGDLPRARQAWEEALAICRELDRQQGVAVVLSRLAQLTLQEKRADAPELLALAIGQFEEALATLRALGDRRGEAGALGWMAAALSQHEQFDAAREKQEEALRISRELGYRTEEADSLESIALLLHLRGDLRGAEAKYREALSVWRTVEGSSLFVLRALRLYSDTLVRQGRLAEADGLLEEASRIAEKLRVNPFLPVSGQYAARDMQCVVLWKRGRLGAVRQQREEDARTLREMNAHSTLAHSLYHLAKLDRAEGNLAAAREKATESLRRSWGNLPQLLMTAQERRLFLTALLLDEGRAAEAEQPARAAVEEAHAKQMMDLEAAAREVLARSLLAQGKSAEAQKALEGAAELSERSGDLGIRLEVTITAARVRAASGGAAGVAAACKALEAAIAEAQAAEFLGEELEARLALGEVELRGGKAEAGRARLEALAGEASQKGYALIARQAAAAAGAVPSAEGGERHERP